MRQAPGPLGNQRGQALVEMGIIIVLFVMLAMGFVEFGRAFMIGNMIAHAARDGARTAAVLGPLSRGDCGSIPSSYEPITGDCDPITGKCGLVKTEIKSVMDPSGLTVTISQAPHPGSSPCVAPPPDTLPVVAVNVSGFMPYIFSWSAFKLGFGPGHDVDLTVTFRDEGR